MKKSDEIQIIEEFFDIIQNYTENNTVYYDDIQVFYKVLQILDRKNKEISKVRKANEFYKREITRLNSRCNYLERARIEKNSFKIEELKRKVNRYAYEKSLGATKNNYTKDKNSKAKDIILIILATIIVLSHSLFLLYLLFWG